MKNNNMIYQVNERPPFKYNIFFSLQQFLSIIAATILVPVVVGKINSLGTIYLSQSSALIGAGVGTIVYLFFSRFQSPVFLGSSFTFVTPLATAVNFGYFGIILGSLFSAIVYVLMAIIIKFVGSKWIDKIMPPVIIGPIVALIGFDLAGSAISNLTSSFATDYNLISILIGLITFFTAVLVENNGGKKLSMFPFIVAILVGYFFSCIFTLIGYATNCKYIQIVDFSSFSKIADFNNWLPNITFIGLINEGFSTISSFEDIITIFVAFIPLTFVAFAEHIADHKNISSIIGSDLFKNPGLHNTLLGDGLGSFSGAIFGGCPNTTYGESIGCVAISKNASTFTIFTTAIICIIIAFFYPAIAFVESIPNCVIGGICISLYGFISVSGLKMIKNINLDDSKNLYVVASIFICGIGGLVLQIENVYFSNVACALIVGIITNSLLKINRKKNRILKEQNNNKKEDEITTNQKEKS